MNREQSLAEKVANLSEEERAGLLGSYSDDELKSLLNDWKFFARPKQHLCLDIEGWKTWMIMSGRGFGKAVSLLELILTENRGWVGFGELKLGDRVFDEQGNPCNVTKLFNIETPEKCYRLTFDDHSTLDVSTDHLFSTWTANEKLQYYRYKDKHKLPDNWVNYPFVSKFRTRTFGSIKTTQEIIDTFYYGKDENHYNHSIPLTKPLEYKHNNKNLLVPAYIIGAWLGDGCKRDGTFSQHTDDEVYLRKFIEELGYKTSDRAGKYEFGVLKLTKDLRELNLLYNKHIPKEYMESSIENRMELLKGLMDTDGHACENRTTCEFSQSDDLLKDQVCQLIVSLGMKVYVSSRVLKNTTSPTKEFNKRNWKIKFAPTFACFKFPRKINTLNFNSSMFKARFHRTIVQYEEITPILMRCIQVDSPNHMFLIGKQLIPNHNSRTASQWLLEKVKDHPNSTVAIIAPTKEGYIKYCIQGDSGILGCAPEGFADYKSSLARIDFANGSVCNLYTAEEPERLRGANLAYVWWDEICSCPKAIECWNMMRMALRQGSNPQVLVTSTPKPHPILTSVIMPEEKIESGEVLVVSDYEDAVGLEKIPKTFVVTGSTYENSSNLPETFIEDMVDAYEGSELGKQEIYGQILKNLDGKIFKKDWFKHTGRPEKYLRTVIGVDPAMTKKKGSDFTGIVVISEGIDNKYYVRQVENLQCIPGDWARKCLKLYFEYGADALVIEANQGGDLVKDVLIKTSYYINNLNEKHIINHDLVNYKEVYATAKNSLSKTGNTGKVGRAEKISILYEKGKVIHELKFVDLEQQFLFLGDASLKNDDVADAAVWALTEIAEKDLREDVFMQVAAGGYRKQLDDKFVPVARREFLGLHKGGLI